MQAENRIVLTIGEFFTVEFESIRRNGQDNDHYVYFRVEGEGQLMSDTGALYINLETKQFSYMYDTLSITGSLDDVKKNGNSVYYAITVAGIKGEISITFYD